jgi:hypothetical protein
MHFSIYVECRPLNSLFMYYSSELLHFLKTEQYCVYDKKCNGNRHIHSIDKRMLRYILDLKKETKNYLEYKANYSIHKNKNLLVLTT